MPKRLAIITTHPIQYYAPVFEMLSRELHIKVFYTAGNTSSYKYDRGFKQNIEWDIPLLSGYEYEFLENTARDKGSHHFNGIRNRDAIQRIKTFEPDAILVYGWSYLSHLNIMRHFKGRTPVYFRGDSNLLDKRNNFKSFLRSKILKWVYKYIDFVFYVGTANKSYFTKYGLRENQLVFAPHAIDNKRFAEDRTSEANHLRSKFRISENDILVLFAGKLEDKKNPELLLDAFLGIKNANIHILFVGNGEQEQSLKDRSAGISQVHFLPFQNQTQMPVIYQACDLFCLPSKGPGETWGLAVNEAMASGKAVLVSDKVGCYPNLINENTGNVFKSEDVSDLKQKLIALSQNKNTLKMMGISASYHIQTWSFENQVKAIAHHVNR